MADNEETGSGFKLLKIHPRNYSYYHEIEEHHDVYQACERFRDFYGGVYSIDRAESDIRNGRLPSDIYQELRAFAVKDKFLLMAFLPNEIVAAILGEKKRSKH